MCKKCKGKNPKCFCRGHITASPKGASPKLIRGKIKNQKGAFGK